MIAPAEAFEPSSTDPLPNSTRVYVEGSLHKNVRVPMREISLSPTKRLDGSLEPAASGGELAWQLPLSLALLGISLHQLRRLARRG